MLVIARDLSFQIEMTNASGRTSAGDPYRRVFLPNGILAPGQSIDVTLRFRRHRQSPPVSFTLTLLSGQGTPVVRNRALIRFDRPVSSAMWSMSDLELAR